MGISKGIKEWSCVIDAMGRGEQTLMIRKGTVYPEFLLYPTYSYFVTHFKDDKLGLALQERFVKSAAESGEITRQRAQKDLLVNIDYYAVADKVLPISDNKILARLKDHYIWNPEHVESYAKTSRTGTVYLWLLRVYKLPKTEVVGRLKQGGIPDLYRHPEEVSTTGSIPVLDDATFTKERDTILHLVGTTAHVGT